MNDLIELPEPNLPLLRKVLDHIDAHPEEHYQAAFVKTDLTPVDGFICATAFCVAGHAVVMGMGAYPVSNVLWVGFPAWHTIGEPGLAPASGQSWYEAGRDVLGLSDQEALALFGGSNTRADVQWWAESIAERGGERL